MSVSGDQIIGPGNNDGYMFPPGADDWAIPGIPEYYVPVGGRSEIIYVSWQFYLPNVLGATNDNTLLHIITLDHNTNVEMSWWSKNAQLQSDMPGQTLWRCYHGETLGVVLRENTTTRVRVYNYTPLEGKVGVWLAFRRLEA